MSGKFSRNVHRQTDFDYPVGTLPLASQYWPREWTEIYHKEYPRFPKIKLSRNILPLGQAEKIIMSRHATREFDVRTSLTFDELATIIHYSAGTKPGRTEDGAIRRFYPSGGARYPLETYLLVQRVDNLTPGLYHFNVKENSLEILSADTSDINSFNEGLYYPWSRDAAAVLVITAVWERNFMKYKDRGYRIVLMEAGHMAQNVSLVSSALGIGCCNSVGFHNGRMNEILDIENEDEDSLYMAVLGR